MENGLMQVIQIPVIEERLRSTKEEVERRTSEAMSLVCTDDTLASVKKVRAELNKQLAELEDQRKAIKEAVMGPYKQFEDTYKECVSGPFIKADAALKDKIFSVENSIKAVCRDELVEYFNELAAAEHVEWLKYEQAGIKIDLTSARQRGHNKLREQVAAFVVRVAQDVNTIPSMDDAEEIMAEYRQILDLGKSIGIVQQRHERIEAERKASEARKAVLDAQREAVQKVEAATPTAFIEPPVAAPSAQQEDEKVYKCSFTVRATKSQLKRLKEFLKEEGIQYE